MELGYKKECNFIQDVLARGLLSLPKHLELPNIIVRLGRQFRFCKFVQKEHAKQCLATLAIRSSMTSASNQKCSNKLRWCVGMVITLQLQGEGHVRVTAVTVNLVFCLDDLSCNAPRRPKNAHKDNPSSLSNSCTGIKNFSPYVGQRIGEAKNPGPKSLLTTLAIINPTSLANKIDDFCFLQEKHQINIFACAETTATQHVQTMFGRSMKQQSFHSLWSTPVEPQRIRIDGQPSLRGKVGGTAIFTQFPGRIPWNFNDLTSPFQTRFVHGVLQIGATWIQILTVYGVHSNVNGAKEFNNELMQFVVKQALNLPLPAIFVGDFNMNVHDLTVFPFLQELGYTSLQDCYQRKYGKPMPPTCKEATTPDTAILHPLLANRLEKIVIDREKVFDTHDPVVVTFSLPSEQIFHTKIRMPETWTKLPITRNDLEQMAPEVLGQNPDIQNLQQWAGAVEETVSQVLQRDFQNDPSRCTFRFLPKKYWGRCQPRMPKKCSTPSLIKKAWDGRYNPKVENTSMKFKRMVRQLRRVQSLRNRLKKMASFESIWHRTIVDVNQEWNTIKDFVFDGFTFKQWINTIPELTPCPEETPTEEWLGLAEQFFKHKVVQIEYHENKLLKDITKTHHETDVKCGHKVKTFRKIKGVELPPFNVVRVQLEKSGILVLDESHRKATIFLDESQNFALYREAKIEDSTGIITAKDDFSIEVTFLEPWHDFQEEVQVKQVFDQHDEAEIFRALNDYWFQFWKRDPKDWNEEVPMDGYIQQLINDRNIFVNLPALDQLGLEDWKKAIHQAKATSSPGIDGITFEEMKQIPDEFVSLLAIIVNGLDVFPKEITIAKTVPLPKTEGTPFAKDSRPITVLPAIYRLWSRLVASKMLQVLGATLRPQVTGMLPARGALSASYNFQFILEQARAMQRHLSGVTLDLRKCFNLISRQKLQALLIRCGFPEDIIKKWIGSLQEMQRFWQVGHECSTFFDTSTGCPEGDSLSVVAMICIAWWWVEGISRIHDEMGSSAYADNWTWWAVDPVLHDPAFRHTTMLTREMGLEVDWNKTWRWETSGDHADIFKKIIEQHVPTGQLELMTNAWDLGTPIAYKATNKLCKMKQRFDKAKARLNRIKPTTWDFDVKIHIILAAVYTVAFYSCEVTCFGQQHLDKFR